MSSVSNGLCHVHLWMEIYWSWLPKLSWFFFYIQSRAEFHIEEKKETSFKKRMAAFQMLQLFLHCALFSFSFGIPPPRSIFTLFSFLSQTVKELTRLRIYPQQWLQFCCACQNLYGH